MAVDSWTRKLRSAVSSTLVSLRSTTAGSAHAKSKLVGILAFEIASLMSKLLHLWRSLSDARLHHLRQHAISLRGLRKIVSDDASFLLGLARAELIESLRLVAAAVSGLAARCADPGLRRFGICFMEFAESGSDPHRWAMSWKEMDAKAKRMDHHVSTTAALYREMERLSETEEAMRKQAHSGDGDDGAALRQTLFCQEQRVKCLKASSLWGRSFDGITHLLARSAFTVLFRINHEFGHLSSSPCKLQVPPPIPRRHSCSAIVHPSADLPPESFPSTTRKQQELGFFEANAAALRPPADTLGAAAMSLHYANIILLLDKMIKAPRLIPFDAKHGLYAMLPASLRALLRARLRGVGRNPAAGDAALAGKWRTAMARIISWLSPLAHNTVRWQADRSLEQRWGVTVPRTDVLLLQTLWFAGREKTEAAIAELLVGLNYVWRFEMELKTEGATSFSAEESHLRG
ncbi:unnamed protein product [Spirodela intermedia]|uniref:Uncharacterized protein n=1 Tax=Spirodela intermedia TaxID=51605 RepID=A0A7I8L0Z5_SPIIN|nr:unnamed protein product [Spirodela intermedia]